MDISEIKLYLRITHDDEDALIESFCEAAENYIRQKTGKSKKGADDIANDVLYKQTVKLMVAHWYENRAVISPSATNKISHTVDALIDHISLCGDYL